MEYVHACAFCGWRRLAPSPTILSPSCPGCGCMLHSERDRRDADGPLAMPPPAPVAPPSPLGRALARAAATVFILASAKAGWDAGGIWVALGALSAMGLVTVPLLAPDG